MRNLYVEGPNIKKPTKEIIPKELFNLNFSEGNVKEGVAYFRA